MCILIISHNDDISTSNVMEWLFYYRQIVLRINVEDEYDLEIILNNNTIEIELFNAFRTLFVNELKAIWFRRGIISIKKPKYTINKINIDFLNEIDQHLSNEGMTISTFVYEQLLKKPHISSPFQYDVNKLHVLSCAVQCGLEIPKTFITNSISRLKKLSSVNYKIITKALSNGLTINFYKQNPLMIQRTEFVDMDTLQNLNNENFYYSLFQTEIEKKYELRIFYLFRKIYAVAIFPYLKNHINIDGRELENENELKRVVPYKLPRLVANKITKLMKSIGLECGSIDMIVTPLNEFVFLEVNPVGQYDYLQKNCNYYIDREIAKSLIKICK